MVTTRFSGVAAGLFVSSTGIFNNSMVCSLCRWSSRQGRLERFRRKGDCRSQAIIGTEAKEVYDTSFQSISTSFVLSRDRGSVEAMSTASDISSIGTAYQIAKSRITCYGLASRHSHRRRQQGPSGVRIAVKAEQPNQNNDPEGREVVQVFKSRLITWD